jgi:broad specificity phosphatase PhoE
VASIYLARHGETAYNLEGRFQGHLPVPLDELGRAQALELAERAATHDFRVLWSSPLMRARETADAVARRTGLEPRVDERLAETDAGAWTDRSFADVRAEAPAQFDAFVAGERSFAFPGGESLVEQQERVASALEDVERDELPALVVCHGMVIRAALSWRVGRWLTHTERVPNGALLPLDPEEGEGPELGTGEVTQPS